MKKDQLARLKTIKNNCGKSRMIKTISPNGREGMRYYTPEYGTIEMHFCQTREDVEASNNGNW